MKTVTFIVAVIFCLAVANVQLRAQAVDLPEHPVHSWFFGMEAHKASPWPTVPFDEMRLWDSGTTWAELNPSDGVYNWKNLDGWLEQSQTHGIHLLLTLAMTPSWASSNPNDPSCIYGPGQCDPPNDLNPDGTGTDQHWKDFVTAVAIYANGRISAWEIWNEPVHPYLWTGTFAQMVRMAQDARSIVLSIDPNAKMLTPPNGAGSPDGDQWWNGYAAAGGLQYADIIALHSYVDVSCEKPADTAALFKVVEHLRNILQNYHQTQPIWNTEASWGWATRRCFTDQDMQAAVLGQFYLLHRTLGLKRIYWYSYTNTGIGELFDRNTQQLTKGGVAYQQVHDWLLGKALSQPCSASGTVWTCGITGPKGYHGEVIWDTRETCSNGTCQTVEYRVGSQFTQYRTLSGETIPIMNGQVPIGAKPILVEN